MGMGQLTEKPLQNQHVAGRQMGMTERLCNWLMTK
jgi:hypothetical protein